MTMPRVWLPAISYQEGLAADRPSAGPDNFWLVWYSTDTEATSFSDGSIWIALGAGTGGSISDITSTDGSITVTNPTGPTTDLALTPATKQEFIGADEVTLAPGTGSLLTFSFVQPGFDTLLDLTDPTYPKFIDDGLYTIHFFGNLDDPTNLVDTVSTFPLGLTFDDTDIGGTFSIQVAPIQGVVLSGPFGSSDELTMTKFFSAGQGFQCTIANGDSSGTVPYSGSVWVTQLNP